MYTSVNHNMMAANTARNLNTHYSRLATSTQRLSSGLRINSAADDAAGLAIRELQRADIAALHQGARNANDAISMIQVADGALGIIDEKLIRMKELAEQAATGTYDSTQRLMIDSEFQAMASEIDRIARATDFNGIHLLDGSLKGKHNGSGLNSTGAMKIHFGSGNDSAEDYYYVEIGDCTTKGLGLTEKVAVTDKTTTYEVVTWTEEEQTTFNGKTNYQILKDPNNNINYYTNGEYYFTNMRDPIGSALNPETDKEFIKLLQPEIVTTTRYYWYDEYISDSTGETFYQMDWGGRSWVRDPNDTETLTSRPDLADLIKTNKVITTEHSYTHYKDKNNHLYYSYDGINFIDNLETPNKVVLRSNNQDQIHEIEELEIVKKETNPPKVNVTYWEYRDPFDINKAYFSDDKGKTFYSKLYSPEDSKLDHVADADLINRLYVMVRYEHGNRSTAELYTLTTPEGTKDYYTIDGGKTFYNDDGYPLQIALDSSNPLDIDTINNLEPVINKHQENISCIAYKDGSGNLFYTYDNGKSYFLSLTDPDGTKSTPGGVLTPSPNDNAKITFWYILYKDPLTDSYYYKKENLDEFVLDPTDPDIILDKSYPSDKVVLDRIKVAPDIMNVDTLHLTYKDPVTNKIYYSFSTSNLNQFVTDVNDLSNIALDSNNSSDKPIIDRLVPEPQAWTVNRTQVLPDQYNIYKDPVTNKIYYNYGGKWTSDALYPFDEYNLLDETNPNEKAILERLQPEIREVTHSKTIEHIIEGETHYIDTAYSISTQEAAQKGLVKINEAIVQKDKIRAHLGALQNRLENTVSNLNIQAENLQAAESRISDTDVATEMTEFVRNQILTQSAVAMLGQANSMPQMMMQLING